MRIALDHLRKILTALFFGAVVLSASHAQTPGSITVLPSGIIYHAQAGDTLMSIASAYTTRIANWTTLGSLNNIAKDKGIPIGTPITIPADLLQDEPVEGKVIARTGTVTGTLADGTSGVLNIGSRIVEGMQITTAANSFLTIGLPDQSRVSLPSNSNVRMTTLRKTRYTASPRVEMMVQRGRVVSRVSPLETNKGSYKVRTPVSVAGVRGTEFRVRVNDKQVATEVLDGRVIASLAQGSEQRSLPRAKGNITSRNKLGPAVDLLPPPQLASTPYRDDTQAHFALAPITNAVGYHIELGTDAEMLNVIGEGCSDSAETVTIDNIAVGTYFARLTAFDANGLEGMPRVLEVNLRQRSKPVGPSSKQSAPTVATSNPQELVLQWQGPTTDRYNIQVARDSDFSWLTYNAQVIGTQARFPRPAFGTYFARVQKIGMDGSSGGFSPAQALIVTDQWIINDGHPLQPKQTTSAAR
ncbi:FecR domain-containing protein [uncultured Oxalicibacterium sp.]|uniref:FecR domain-containing protein n=1 Tax=uncultured Oxalicibacterium sp. TaxID=1168540 RepID=UPI0025EA26B6|nr:FecR domain-containing protein [uncultured Oxalicibacterium sp.]